MRLVSLAAGATVLVVSIVASASACRSTPAKDILNTEKKLYSQHDEELIVRQFFNDQKGGVFLDVGCYDWKDGSTTLYLEEKLGWSGIGVDAQPQLRAGYEQHRPRTKFLNYIVTDHSGAIEQLFMDGQISSIDAHHIDQFPNAKGETPVPINVPTITLNDLLAENRVTRLDFVSIDIEGAEPKALAGFDIEKYKPRLVCIEASPELQETLMKYFTAHGYELIEEYLPYDAVNWYFRPKR
jgi:FkbM family methyltransferase